MNMVTRKADLKDKDKVSQVLLVSGMANSLEEAEDMFLKETKKGDTYILAEKNDVPLGIVTWIFHGSFHHGLAELYHIGVIPEKRGKGVADALFKAMLDDINSFFEKNGHKLRKLYLLTHIDNERARGFYERMGLEHEANLKDHFYNGKDECVYSYFPK